MANFDEVMTLSGLIMNNEKIIDDYDAIIAIGVIFSNDPVNAAHDSKNNKVVNTVYVICHNS